MKIFKKLKDELKSFMDKSPKRAISNTSSKPLKDNMKCAKNQCKSNKNTQNIFKYIIKRICNNLTLINNYDYIFQKSARKILAHMRKAY